MIHSAPSDKIYPLMHALSREKKRIDPLIHVEGFTDLVNTEFMLGLVPARVMSPGKFTSVVKWMRTEFRTVVVSTQGPYLSSTGYSFFGDA